VNRLATIVAVVITTAWAVSFILDAVVATYEPPPSVHPLMLMVAGSLFGGAVLRETRKNGGNGNGNGNNGK